MRIITLEKGEDVSQAVKRLYRVSSAKQTQLLERALRQANPQLTDAKTVPSRTVIVAPDIEGVDPVGTGDPQQLALSLIRTAREQIGDLSQDLSPRLNARETAAKTVLARLD